MNKQIHLKAHSPKTISKPEHPINFKLSSQNPGSTITKSEKPKDPVKPITFSTPHIFHYQKIGKKEIPCPEVSGILLTETE